MRTFISGPPAATVAPGASVTDDKPEAAVSGPNVDATAAVTTTEQSPSKKVCIDLTM